ncbi:AraC family transcriptional regulator [Chelativorans sp. SCAU2101]|uniref:AraC family transcriptional regulator n=1 Tax=Chelativorans petroleitrophicus TaxID=2975484 RepID=A0A9X2X983_9HYPH|nr:AraC family transcriptional regulator [Chelativorans petroleitrophicus]
MLSALIGHGHAMRRITPPKGGVGLHCMAGGAGFELRVNEIYSWDGLRRGPTPFVLIQHTIAGEGRLDYAGAQHCLRPGETMLLTFPHANRYWLERGGRWEYFWIILTGREALRLAGAIIEERGPVLRPSTEGVDRLAGACLALLSGSADRPGAISCAAYAALAALYDDTFATQKDADDLPSPVRRAVAFVDENLARPIDVGAIARAAGFSRAHFVRLFAAAMDEPPSAYLLRRRMDRAERMLLATDAPVEAIARVCGFADANYFSKVFRRAHGVSPTVYRSSGRKGLAFVAHDGVADAGTSTSGEAVSAGQADIR